MDNLIKLIGFASALIVLATTIAAVIPMFITNISTGLRSRIVLSIVTAGCLFAFFKSNFYMHWRYFDPEKIHFISGQLPHSMKEDNQLFHKYILKLENNYTRGIEAKDLILNINSRMPILNYDVLLSDIKKDSLTVTIQNLSELRITIDKISGGQIFSITYECRSRPKNNLPKDLKFELFSTLKMLEYEVLGRHHSCICQKGLNVKLSNNIYNRKDILFEKVAALDHRKIPYHLRTEYQYAQWVFDNKKRVIGVFCSTDRHLNLIYDGICGILRYKSKKPINENISLLRVISFNDDYFLHESTIPMEKTKK